jgi:hypothetical protein
MGFPAIEEEMPDPYKFIQLAEKIHSPIIHFRNEKPGEIGAAQAEWEPSMLHGKMGNRMASANYGLDIEFDTMASMDRTDVPEAWRDISPEKYYESQGGIERGIKAGAIPGPQ